MFLLFTRITKLNFNGQSNTVSFQFMAFVTVDEGIIVYSN